MIIIGPSSHPRSGRLTIWFFANFLALNLGQIMKKLSFAIFVAAFCMTTNAQNIGYQSPPQVIKDLVDAPPTPGVTLSPDKAHLLFLHLPNLPSIEEVAREELRLGGLRINPQTNGGSRSRYYHGLSLQAIGGSKKVDIKGFPADPRIENLSWAPDGSRLACTHTTSQGMELWIVDVASAQATRIEGLTVNDVISGIPYQWFPDSRRLLVQQLDPNRGAAPQEPETPAGPVIQENTQGAAPVRTYQDLLKNPFDEDLFQYYTSSQLMVLDVEDGAKTDLGIAGIVAGRDISPDGQYILVTTLKRPFSYIVPYYRFAQEVTLYRQDGQLVRQLAHIPAAENIPKGFNAVRLGPRSFGWRADTDATLYWVEAQDGGDPKKAAAIRDRLYLLNAPFTGDAEASIDFELRFRGITWGDDHLAISREYWWSSRREIVSTWAPGTSNPAKNVLYDRSYEDRYTDPGSFQTDLNASGRSVLQRAPDGDLFLTGIGASPAGNRPFVDRFDLEKGQAQRLWQSEAPYYEIPMKILDAAKGILITRRESVDDNPNYFLRDLTTASVTQITHFPHPYEAMRGVSKQLVKYQRADGIELTGTLYLPPKYNPEEDGKLPVLMWAYPREYKTKDAASQVRNSPYEFLRLYYGSPIYWVMNGYAVFDNFAMPIIGEGDEEPNEQFVPQLVQGAEAAIDKIVEMGVADRRRLAVGGHSYGAFMTANLLAHSDLFAAGIARSGAYNRTLTPFGFQSEERTFWEAPEIYFTMSPFMHADKIREPILLIHGSADNNSGTYPMQSERFYAALKGHGGIARLVMLPHESHGYRARESIMHMLWEMDQWLEKHVKNRDRKVADPSKKTGKSKKAGRSKR